ncbi:STAS domain-containing protein [Saccharothrix sp. Mg75]|uniref:STAS domain-containing protein n=1 Tax=Saccharothrix sp. Mg75 TaxID=3445357 RepID=UPI003EEA0C22
MAAPQHLICTTALVDGTTARVVASGDLTYDNGDLLRDAVADLLAGHRPARLHVDCAALTFCDSFGLSVLLDARRTAEGAATALVLDNRPAWLDRLLQRTGTYDYLVPEDLGERQAG